MPDPSVHFHTLSIEAALKHLDSSPTGLTSTEVKKRFEHYGPNTLPTSKALTWWQLFITQFNSPLVYVLLAAALISLALHETVDAIVIVVAVLIQVVVGFIQEFRAQSSLQALQRIIALSARVRRGDAENVVNAVELVPGDVVVLQAGDKIPADVRLLEVDHFEVNEAALTGESDAVLKDASADVEDESPLGDRINLAFSGTVATKGSAVAVITHTGAHTEMGTIARLIKDTEEGETPLQQQLNAFAKKISLVVIGIAVGIFLFGYFVLGQVTELFTVAVAVAVSAIPEGLAIAVTIILAAGMRRILKRKALVRKLVAAETLGSTTVICTDKTGTLTEGNMQVTDFVTWQNDFALNGKHHKEYEAGAEDLILALRIGLLCNDAKINNPGDMIDEWVLTGNLTERALLEAGIEAGLYDENLHKTAPRVDTVPFDSAIKYMATLHREPQGRMLYVKGAPEIIASKCSRVLEGGKEVKLTDSIQKKFEHKFLQLSKQGLRIIALAYKNTEKAKTIEEAKVEELVFVGYVGIKDPLRKEAKQTVAECLKAGVKVVMITGDHKLTAKAIASELGLDVSGEHSVMEGAELDKLSQHELNQVVQEINVYARVTPQHKLRIVQAWQSHQHVVAMTGDGINDAPAIKAADIGVALGSGTDVAKETADMVILNDDFSTIVAAVEEGRGIFDNIRKTVLYLLSDSFTEVLLVVIALFMGLPVPVTAAMILWINIVNDSFPSLAMTQEKKEPESMLEPPRGRKNRILDTEVNTLIGLVSLITGIANLGLFYWSYTTTQNIELARTLVFLSLGIDSLLFMFSLRNLRRSILTINPFGNPWLIVAFVVGVALQALPIYLPLFQTYFGTMALSLEHWGLVVAIILVELVIIEICKMLFIVRTRKQRKLTA